MEKQTYNFDSTTIKSYLMAARIRGANTFNTEQEVDDFLAKEYTFKKKARQSFKKFSEQYKVIEYRDRFSNIAGYMVI